jgi:hypothetical protein
MTKPTVRIHNVETDEIIDREMTKAEFTQFEKDQAYFAQIQAEAETKANEKAALLNRLGITDDEAKLLLG